MHRLQLDQDIKPLSQFRAHVTSFIKQVQKTNRPLVLTQHGKSAAVVLNVHEYETLLARLELLQDIHDAEREMEGGKAIPHDLAKRHVLSSLKK